jgi:hypothetical protein
MKMTIDGHYKGSGESHNRGKEYAKEKGINRMIQEDIGT